MKYPQKREKYIGDMYDFGSKGERDFDRTAKKVVKSSKKLIKRNSLRKLPSKFDVNGYDMPRSDIGVMKTTPTRTLRVGNDHKKNINDFKKYILPKIQHVFTKQELDMIYAYFEYPNNKMSNLFAGLTSGWVSKNGKRFSIIDINNLHKKDMDTITHELIHALRFAKKDRTRDIDKDEAETQLETLARLSNTDIKKIRNSDTGYYEIVGGVKSMMNDRKMITSKCKLNGGLSKCVKKNLGKSIIGKINIPNKYIPKLKMNPENIDRDFVVVKDGKEIYIQGNYGNKTTEGIKKLFITTYGKNIKIYEYKDGKKKLL